MPGMRVNNAGSDRWLRRWSHKAPVGIPTATTQNKIVRVTIQVLVA